MPKALEAKLRREANKKRLSKKRKNAYIYGTMMKRGLMSFTPKKAQSKNYMMG